MTAFAERLRRLLPGLWLGVIVALGGVAAPSLFALLEPAQAGRVAGRLFGIEARIALGLCVALFLLERGRAARRARAGQGSRISVELVLVLGALFCTVLGQFALQPMLEAARAGQGAWSFAALHRASGALFLLKASLVGALAWRAAQP